MLDRGPHGVPDGRRSGEFGGNGNDGLDGKDDGTLEGLRGRRRRGVGTVRPLNVRRAEVGASDVK